MVLIIFYAACNLGDDLFVKHLCFQYKQTCFVMYCPYEFRKAFEKIQNLKLLYEKDDIKNYRSLIKLQILIGGSLFMQPSDNSKIYNKFLFNKQYRYFSEIPFIIIGANFGPYDDILHYQLHKEWFKKLEYITFRDVYSFSLFKDMKNISYSPDILFGYPLNKQEKKNSIGVSCIYNNNRIGLPKYDNNSYIENLARICDLYIQKGFEVRLYSFCNKQLDNISVNRIFNKVNDKEHIHKVEYTGDTDLFLKDFLSNEFILGTRFHSIVLALSAGIPVFPIIYNIKTQNLLVDLGFTGNSIEIAKCNDLSIEYVEHNRIIPFKIPVSIKQQSFNHFMYIDSFIKKG